MMIFTVIVLSIAVVSASDIYVYRTAPTEIRYDSILQVNITVVNNGISEEQITVMELIGNVEVIEPHPIYPEPDKSGRLAIHPPYFEWQFTLPSNSSKTVVYKVKPLNPGYIILSPTKVYVGDKIIYTESLTIKVICNRNKLCEVSLGENDLTCPEDCPSGSEDNTCSIVKDGRCDPDCLPNYDPDCSEKPERNKFWIYSTLGIIIITLIFLVVIILTKAKKEDRSR